MKTLSGIGEHGLLDLYGINPALASNPHTIEQHLLHAAQLANATVLNTMLHHFGENQGVTGILLLSESHISIHTWPEQQFAAIDIFMCGPHRIQAAIDHLLKAFAPTQHTFTIHTRGQVNPTP